MPRLKAQTTRFRWHWWVLIALLLALRAPSLVQPAGGDQGLYGYAGQRILAGDVMYRDVWDQKPPAIAFQYGILGQIWPGEGIAPASDLAAAAAVAWLLVILGRQTFSADVGYAAAAIFLLFGDPYLQRLSGIYVRGQCEPFVALAVTASLALLTRPNRARSHLIAAGVALAWAFWSSTTPARMPCRLPSRPGPRDAEVIPISRSSPSWRGLQRVSPWSGSWSSATSPPTAP